MYYDGSMLQLKVMYRYGIYAKTITVLYLHTFDVYCDIMNASSHT